MKASELKGDAGPIPASAVDIKVVKCWYQSGSAWHNQKQDKSKRVLVPELLLNDETLVKVDREKQENYVKLRFPEGDKYVWISNPEYDPDWEKKPQPNGLSLLCGMKHLVRSPPCLRQKMQPRL